MSDSDDRSRPYAMPGGSVEVEETRRRHDGFLKVDEVRLRHRRFSGGWTPSFVREVCLRPDAVCVLPYDPVRDAVVLIEQFRLPAHLRGNRGWQVEIVGGLIEDGEAHEDNARRECMEEAGLRIGRLEFIGSYMPTQATLTETVHLYVAEADVRETARVAGLEAEHEDIRVMIVPWKDLEALRAEGLFQNAPILMSYFWLQIHRERLRRAWTSPQAAG